MTETINELLIEGNLKFQWELLNESKNVYVPRIIPKYPVLILTCMDSRIDINKIFHLNPGDVFILRNAGNVYSKDIIRSILLAIFEFRVKFIVILGHLDCKITKVNLNDLKDKLPTKLVYHISKKEFTPQENIARFFKIIDDELKNINNHVKFLKQFPDFPKETEILGMLYDVNTGWIFESKDFEHYESKEKLLMNYKDLLMQKHSKLTEFVKKLKLEENELNPLNKIEPLENFEKNNYCKFFRLNTKPLKIVSQAYIPKISIKNRINPVKIFDNRTSFNNFKNMNLEIIVPNCIIPKFKLNYPKFKLKNNDMNSK